MFVTSLCSIAARKESIESLIPRIAAAGYEAVELISDHVDGNSPAELERLRKLAEAHNVVITVLSPYFAFTQTQEAYDKSVECARRFVDYAHALNCSRIRTFTDCGPNGINTAKATPDHWRSAISGLKEITAIDRSIDFLLETHPYTVADRPESIERLLEEVDTPNLKLIYQPTNPDFLHEGIIANWRRFRSHVAHIHLNNVSADNDEGYVEEGILDLAQFLRVIQEDGYNGTVSVEYCWADVPWRRVESASKFVRSHLIPRS